MSKHREFEFEIFETRFIDPDGWIEGPSLLSHTSDAVPTESVNDARRSVELMLDESGVEYDSEHWEIYEGRHNLQGSLEDQKRAEPKIINAFLWVYEVETTREPLT